MKLPSTRALGAPVHWVTESPSTNLTLREMWESNPALPNGTVVITDRQVAGRGRQGRGWETPPGKALAVSVILRDVPGEFVTWLPLVVASAAIRALEPLFAHSDEVRSTDTRRSIGVKWPNDVHALSSAQPPAPTAGTDPVTEPGATLAGKLAGILCELLPDGSVIAGIGMNLFQTREELPTDRAGSLVTEGAALGRATTLLDPEGEQVADELLTRFFTALHDLRGRMLTEPNAVKGTVNRDSATLKRAIRVILPDGTELHGTAADTLDDSGALVFTETNGKQHTVHSGDVEHVREWFPDEKPGGGE